MYKFKTKVQDVTIETGMEANPDGFNPEPYIRTGAGLHGKTPFSRKDDCVVTYPDGHRIAVKNERISELFDGPHDKLFPVEETTEEKIQKAVKEAVAAAVKPVPVKMASDKKVTKKTKKEQIPHDE